MAMDDKLRMQALEQNLMLILETLVSVHAGIRSFAQEHPESEAAILLSDMADALVKSKISSNYEYHSSKVDDMVVEIKRTYHLEKHKGNQRQ